MQSNQTEVRASIFTVEQENELRRLKAWVPFRIVWGATFESHADFTRHTLNRYLRNGWLVATVMCWRAFTGAGWGIKSTMKGMIMNEIEKITLLTNVKLAEQESVKRNNKTANNRAFKAWVKLFREFVGREPTDLELMDMDL